MTATSPPRAEFFRRVDSVSSTGRDGAAAVLPMALDDDGVSVCVCGGAGVEAPLAQGPRRGVGCICV